MGSWCWGGVEAVGTCEADDKISFHLNESKAEAISSYPGVCLDHLR